MILNFYTKINNNYIKYYIIYNNKYDSKKDLIKKILSRDFKYKIYDLPIIKNYIEIGPKISFKTTWCSNIIEIFKRSGIENIERIEYSTLYEINEKNINYDKMLYEIYPHEKEMI